VLFVPYIILVVKGFFKNGVLTIWTGLLFVGSFSALVVPFSAVQYWHRWMFMLVYPFTFFAVSGLRRVLSKFSKKRITLHSLFANRKASVMVLLTFSLGIAYLAAPVTMVFTGMSVASVSETYVYFSDSPAVPYEYANGVAQALKWVNSNMDPVSCVVLQHALQFWGKLYLDSSRFVVLFEKNPDLAATTAFERGFSRVFFVWWNKPNGWYGVTVPDGFVSVQDFGRISVYAYEGELVG
jgi:hypothetical protein